jgi:hypothetical protein
MEGEGRRVWAAAVVVVGGAVHQAVWSIGICWGQQQVVCTNSEGYKHEVVGPKTSDAVKCAFCLLCCPVVSCPLVSPCTPL